MYLIKNGEKVKISSIENYKHYSHKTKDRGLLYILLALLIIAIIGGATYLIIKKSKKSEPRPRFR